MSEERFIRIETKLDGVVSDVAVLKADVSELKVGQTSMEERLVAQMRMLHEDTIDRLRKISEAQDKAHDLARERDSRYFMRILDNHEHRITALENPQSPR
jgi:hypothetical protein